MFKYSFLMRLSYLFNSYSFSHLSHTSDLLSCKSVCSWPDGSDFRHNCVLMSCVKVDSWVEERDPSLCLSWGQCRQTQPLYVLFDICCLFKQCISDSGFATVPAYLVRPVGRRRLDSGFLGNQHLLLVLLEQHINLAVADGAGSSILSCGV